MKLKEFNSICEKETYKKMFQMYEGLTVNADIPEQLSSLTHWINKKQMKNKKKKITKLLENSKQIQFKEKT